MQQLWWSKLPWISTRTVLSSSSSRSFGTFSVLSSLQTVLLIISHSEATSRWPLHSTWPRFILHFWNEIPFSICEENENSNKVAHYNYWLIKGSNKLWNHLYSWNHFTNVQSVLSDQISIAVYVTVTNTTTTSSTRSYTKQMQGIWPVSRELGFQLNSSWKYNSICRLINWNC